MTTPQPHDKINAKLDYWEKHFACEPRTRSLIAALRIALEYMNDPTPIIYASRSQILCRIAEKLGVEP